MVSNPISSQFSRDLGAFEIACHVFNIGVMFNLNKVKQNSERHIEEGGGGTGESLGRISQESLLSSYYLD